MKYIFIFYLLLIISIYPQQKWLRVNGPEGGIITALYAKGDTLLAGAGYDDGVIYYSTNKGDNWHLSTYTSNYIVRSFSDTPDNSFIAACDTNGIYKTNDLVNWTRKVSFPDAFLSVGKDRVGNIYAGTEGGGLYSSSNNGNNWKFSFSNFVPYGIHNFIMHPSGDVFAGAQTSVIRKKIDSGWFKVSIDSLNNVYRLTVDDSGNVYSILEGFARCFFSSDRGESWHNHDTTQYLKYRYTRDLKYNKRLIVAEYKLFLNEPGGVLLSDDKGYTWRKTLNGLLPGLQPMVLAVSGEDTFLGTEGNGIYKSTDFGDTWLQFGKGFLSSYIVKFIIDKKGNYYTASWQEGISKSTDKGASWRLLRSGLNNCNFYSIIADDSNILYAGSEDGLYKSTNNGENWVKIYDGFAYHLFKDQLNRLYFVDNGGPLLRSSDQGSTWLNIANYSLTTALLEEKGIFFAGGYSGKIYKSTNAGLSWYLVRSSNIAEASIGTFCKSQNGYLFANSFFEGILRSTNNGESWTLLNNLNSRGGYGLTVNKKDEIYATAWVGRQDKIFSSSDYGETWKDMTQGLIFNNIREISCLNGDSLFLATSQGLWKSNPDSVVSIRSNALEPKQFSLSQNYPNPFNPTTKIRYSVPEIVHVLMKVFDILGREVITLIDEEKSPGEYEITFSSNNLASGVYIYRVTAGGFSQARSMVTIK